MSILHIDARGFACPEPVLMTKKALDQKSDKIEVLVDNATAMQNIKRFITNNNYKIEIEKSGSEYKLIISK